MTHFYPKDYAERRQRNLTTWGDPPEPEASSTDPKITKLYGPKGQVLRTFSDRHPVGFRSNGGDR